MKSKPLPDDVLRALAECNRAPGWNNRNPNVRRFTLPGNFGRTCTLYVVPFRRWAYRRIEQQAAQWHREQEGMSA